MGLNYTKLSYVLAFLFLAYLSARYLFVILAGSETSIIQIGAADIYFSITRGLTIDLNNYRQYGWVLEFVTFFSIMFLSFRIFSKQIKPTKYFASFLAHLPKIKKYFIVNSYLSTVFFLVLLVSYVNTQLPDVQNVEYSLWDAEFVEPYIKSCNLDEIPEQRALLKFYQFCLSQRLFDNPKIIPFAESIGILVLVFILGNRITNSRYGGLLASMVVVSSGMFVENATALGFSTEWVFFLLLAVLMVYKRPELVGVFYLVSLFAKGMGFLYIPVMVYFIWNTCISQRQKKIAIMSLLAVVPVGIFYTLFVGNHLFQTNVFIGLNLDGLLVKLYNPVWNFTQEVNDSLLLNIILPITIIGLWKIKEKIGRAFLAVILYLFSMQIWLPLFSGYPMGDYRMVPFVIFLSIGFIICIYNFIINRISIVKLNV